MIFLFTDFSIDADVIPAIMSSVEISMGIFFASCPVLRQFVVYVLRERTVLPSKQPPPPNHDFLTMRKRIALRDIFWYREASPKAALPLPNSSPKNCDKMLHHRKEVQNSSMDHVWGRLSQPFIPGN